MAAPEIALVNQRTGAPIATSVERAMTRATRSAGCSAATACRQAAR